MSQQKLELALALNSALRRGAEDEYLPKSSTAAEVSDNDAVTAIERTSLERLAEV
jgi:hypothetical protein